MAPRSFLVPEAIADYLDAHCEPPDRVVRALMERTDELGEPAEMRIGVDQARLLTTLVRFGDVHRALEVGTFTGMSALAIARGLRPGGRLLCCDVDEAWTSMAREAWSAAGVADLIDLRLAPAAETLVALHPDEAFDFAFLDADKVGYPAYFELIVDRMRPGGLLVADNTLQGGRVADLSDDSDAVRAVRAFNDLARRDPRVDTVMLAVADGLTVCQRV